MAHHRPAGLDPHDVLLSMTELVTNAARHGLGPIDIDLSDGACGLQMRVTDRSDNLPRQPPSAADSGDGRGLLILDMVATRWGVQQQPQGGKTVWCEFAGS
jgi:anti-sigma regulatory factor (Ser/Thr protein kinase)